MGFSRCANVAGRWIVAGMASAAWAVAASAMAGDELGFRVPDGFEVTLFADDSLAHDIYSMTIDARGRVVVAGRGYVKTLHDGDGDGRADRATQFSSRPASGAHGMYFEGNDLVCTGDNALLRLRDADGDGAADVAGGAANGPPEVLAKLAHPEHGANGVIRGPDGWYYVICGNDAGLSTEHVGSPYSPVRDPNCGGVVRISPDGKQREVVAHGMRNPYRADFNAAGHLFTVDADGERDQYLPWYAPTRLFDIAQGMHHGWVLRGWTRSWNRPTSFSDNVPRLVEIGRGSPTGLVVYRHRQFPERYRGGVFSACWTLGRIYFMPLRPEGSSYAQRDDGKEVFMQTTGQTGFAPVDLAVGPEGDLLVAIGGRGTRGSVFRVHYTKAAVPPPTGGDELSQILAADQPLASWSRARWEPLARKLGRQPFDAAVVDRSLTVEQRVRAIEVLTELFGGVSLRAAQSLEENVDPTVMGRVLWSLSRRFGGHADRSGDDYRAAVRFLLAEMKRHPRPAWEALATLPWLDVEGAEPPTAKPSPRWRDGLGADDRRVRAAAIAVARGTGSRSVELRELVERRYKFSPGDDLHKWSAKECRIRLGCLWVTGPPARGDDDEARRYADLCGESFSRSGHPRVQLDALRLLQLALGDVRTAQGQPDLYAGYAAVDPDALPLAIRQGVGDRLAAERFGLAPEVRREMARLAGMLEVADPRLPAVVVRLHQQPASPQDDVHYLIVLSRLRAGWNKDVTGRVAETLVRLHGKMESRGYQASRNWPLVVGEVFDELCRRDPTLADAVVRHAEFGRPEHSLFAARTSGATRVAAARRILAMATKPASADAAGAATWTVTWTAEMIAVLAELPEPEILPLLRDRWDEQPSLRDAIVLVMARKPQPQDRRRLVAALSSPQSAVVVVGAKALLALDQQASPDEMAAAVGTLREYCAAAQHADVRAALAGLLAHWTGQRFKIDERGQKDLRAAYQPWFDWLAKTHPRKWADLSGFGPADPAAWGKRLAAIRWETGDARRGRVVFEVRSCHRCHGGAGPLGPDLVGAASRFSRDDLFAAVVDPNKDVSPLYQTVQVTTRSGQVVHGLLVYESPEGSLVQTGPDTTIRITDEDLAQRRPSRQSLMPTGLLNGATDGDLADMYRYLQSLDRK